MEELNNNIPTEESLLKRAELFIDEKEWDKGNEYCNRVLDINPENAQAYIKMLLCKYQCKTFEELIILDKHIENDSEFKNAYRFGDLELKKILEDYLNTQKNKEKEDIYINACSKMNVANSLDISKAQSLFDSIKDYKDSTEKLEFCKKKYEEFVVAETKQKKVNSMFIISAFIIAVITYLVISSDITTNLFPEFNTDGEMVTFLKESNWAHKSDNILDKQLNFIDNSMHVYELDKNHYSYNYQIVDCKKGIFKANGIEYTIEDKHYIVSPAETFYMTNESRLIDRAYTIEETIRVKEKKDESKSKNTKKQDSKLQSKDGITILEKSLSPDGDYYNFEATLRNDSVYTITYFKYTVFIYDQNGKNIDSDWSNWSGTFLPGSQVYVDTMIKRHTKEKVKYRVTIDEILY